MCFDRMPVEEPYWVPDGKGSWTNMRAQTVHRQTPRPRLFKRDGRWWCYTPGVMGYCALAGNSSMSEPMQRMLAYREWKASARRLGIA